MEDRWRTGGGQVRYRWRTGEVQVEDGWRTGGGRVRYRWRTGGGQVRYRWRTGGGDADKQTSVLRLHHGGGLTCVNLKLTIRMATKQASVVFQSPPVAAAFPTRTL